MDSKQNHTLQEDIRSLSVKLDQVNEQITIIRIEMAEHRVRINEDRRFHSSLWGILGGAISAVLVGLMDFIFKK